MDAYLLAWALRVKARQAASRRAGRRDPPPLWMFTDLLRRPDPLPAVRLLPRALCGVVLRHDGMAGRAALGRDIARLCRARRLWLVVAGDWRLAASLHAGLHLRGGRLPGPAPRWLPRVTSSAHTVPEAVRARRRSVALTFISPVFPTASHPGGRSLGVHGWMRIGRLGRVRGGGALGGIAGRPVRRLPSVCAAIGGIEAFEPGRTRGTL